MVQSEKEIRLTELKEFEDFLSRNGFQMFAARAYILRRRAAIESEFAKAEAVPQADG